MKIQSTTLVLAVLSLALSAGASDGQFVTNRLQAMLLVQGLKYQHGEVNLHNGLAKLDVPPEFKFLDRANTEKVLVNLWRNPASPDTLGMLFPADKGPLDEDCWAVTISYAADGYVKDDDASNINYSELLTQMQKDAQRANRERVKRGYPSAELVGWATPPHYDAKAHKLYWAKEIRFGGEPGTTLNYNIRMLGRRGVLVVNAIANMNQLQTIEQSTPEILGMINFNEGHRYVDFNPKSDKVAAYGIAALVAAGVAAKLGLFKLLWVFVLGAKKLIIVVVAVIATWFKKLFRRKDIPGPAS